MHLKFPCFECAFENIYIENEETIPISEEDLYYFKCRNGHDNFIEIQAFKFELLFQSGLSAIKDKYYLESVLSITAGLERFYEFFVRIILRSKRIDIDLINKMYKDLSNQSERQLGSFVVLHTIVFSETPKLLDNKMIAFRNNVVHKGYLPTKIEVKKYAENVYDTIKATYLRLLSGYYSFITDEQHEIKCQRRKKLKRDAKKVPIKITGIAPVFVLTHLLSTEEFQKKTFEEGFKSLRKF